MVSILQNLLWIEVLIDMQAQLRVGLSSESEMECFNGQYAEGVGL